MQYFFSALKQNVCQCDKHMITAPNFRHYEKSTIINVFQVFFSLRKKISTCLLSHCPIIEAILGSLPLLLLPCGHGQPTHEAKQSTAFSGKMKAVMKWGGGVLQLHLLLPWPEEPLHPAVRSSSCSVKVSKKRIREAVTKLFLQSCCNEYAIVTVEPKENTRVLLSRPFLFIQNRLDQDAGSPRALCSSASLVFFFLFVYTSAAFLIFFYIHIYHQYLKTKS